MADNRRLQLTYADNSIQKCLDEKRSFAVIAGAGSGKTTSLILALDYLRQNEERHLRQNGQQIVCITYTKRAVEVINKRLGFDELFHVSTLHSFLWGTIKRLTPNIRVALREHIIPAQIEKKRKYDNGKDTKTAMKARAKIASLENDLQELDNVASFTYDDQNFSNYAKGELSHDDVIAIASYLIESNAILRQIIGQKYPYIFVDEAQDTFQVTQDALNALCEGEGLPIIGYFGDPMQQIYDDGRAGDFGGPADYETITKKENYRSSPVVIDFLNAFRKDIQQVPEGENAKIGGSVVIKLIKSQVPKGDRNTYTDEQIEVALKAFDEALQDWNWDQNTEAKQLFLTHQMIARRLGFSELNSLFTGTYASSNAEDDYKVGEHFLLKPFLTALVPLIAAHCSRDQKEVLRILRNVSPRFNPTGANATKSLAEMLKTANTLVDDLANMWSAKSVREILAFCQEKNLCDISARLGEHLDRSPRDEEYNVDVHEPDKGDWLADDFMTMKTDEIEIYCRFINENTEYSTQHGVKGEEYKDVLVVIDDIEAKWNLYSFAKMLTPNALSEPTDGQKNRSMKLAYVCFSRAIENLRIVLFTPDPVAARKELIANGLFQYDQIEVICT